jgi:predicted DNA-binding protein (UPF0251 family)
MDNNADAKKPDSTLSTHLTPASITSDLLEALRTANTIDDYVKQHESEYINMSLREYFESLLESKKLKKADIIKSSQICRIYGYQILAGAKCPSRDKLIALAFAMKLSFEECQRLLRLASINELYAKNKRDSIIIFGFMRGLSNEEINGLLYEMDELVLNDD